MTARLEIKNEKYYAVISYKDGGSYKQKWISMGLPAKNNKRTAEKMLGEIMSKYEGSYSTLEGDMLYTSFLKRWLKEKKDVIELSTWENYENIVTVHLIPYFEPMKLTLRELRPQHFIDYYHFKYTSGRKDGKAGGLSIRTLKDHKVVIVNSLSSAEVAELIVKNPAKGVKLPAKDTSQHDRVFLTASEANDVIAAFDGHPLQTFVYVTLYYGLRRSEALGLRWSAVDFDRDTISVNHTVVKNKTIVEKDKTKTQSSYHTYKLLPDVKKALLNLKAKQDANRKEFADFYIDSDYIFTWDDGRLFRPDYVTRSFQRCLKSHGFSKMRFHDLRHSTASILYDDNWSMKDIQSWLRHASIDVTNDIYTHISEDRKLALADKMNGMFSKIGGKDEK